MMLRTRLVLGVVVTAIPLSLLIALAQTHIETGRALERVKGIATARMADGMRERCEEAPHVFPAVLATDLFLDDVLGLTDSLPVYVAPPPDPAAPRIFAYDETFRSENPRAPRLPRALVNALGAGDEAAMIVTRGRRGRPPRERALVRMPWRGGPCAILLVEHPAPPDKLRPRVLVPLFVAFAIALTMWLVVGPVERRIRALTRTVREGGAPHLEDETRDEIGDLSRAFSERSARIAAQMQAIEGREQALREYIANTTHDVLAPVAVLKTQLAEIETLARAGTPIPTPLAISALEETHYLAALVHNLNAQARLDAGLVRGEEPIDLAAIAERAVSRHTPLAARQGISLDFAVPEGGVWVLGDITLIEQALSNLVGNAVRYNARGGHVAVVLASRGGAFTLEVLDDGPGVSGDVLARLGERGFRTNEARTRRPDGMGLGLHIAREVAEAHGFRLVFRQNEPTGLSAVLTGPIAESMP